jgi:HPt (histidine-containing phosphotransfer) domain-containing protein
MERHLEKQDSPAVPRWEPPPSLASFAATAQPAVIRELIDVFVQDAEQQLGLLQAAAGAGDIGAVARISHSIKGSSQAMGATNMIELSRSMEEGARLGQQRDYAADAGRLAIVFGETRAAMLAYCVRVSA